MRLSSLASLSILLYCNISPVTSSSFSAAICSSSTSSAVPDPIDVGYRAISKLISQPFTADLWSWAYGPAIQMSTMYQISHDFPGCDFTSVLNDRLDSFINDNTSVAYAVLHNITLPFDTAIGDRIGLMPIAYLSRFDYYNESTSNSINWEIATKIADQYIYHWPHFLPDGTISRDSGWPNQPDKNASFLWCDDQFMGTTLLSRLIMHNSSNSNNYADFIAKQQIQFAKYQQDTDGLFWHGYNYATDTVSCCKWGRANGWVMMSHAEIVPVLASINHPLLPQIITIWQNQAAGLAAVQNTTDGRWHQVLDHPETFLETSVTSMTLYSLITGVMGGWLDRTKYDPVIQTAWLGLASTVQLDGTVNGISCGTGIGTDVTFYQERPTNWTESAPGLGSVFRACRAYWEYSQ